MATHSSFLTWSIPWTEELGGLQSMGSRRVGSDMTEQLTLKNGKHYSRMHFMTDFFWDFDIRG